MLCPYCKEGEMEKKRGSLEQCQYTKIEAVVFECPLCEYKMTMPDPSAKMWSSSLKKTPA